jgi:hypothetical protein
MAIVKEVTKNWRIRESERFINGDYERVPWSGQSWFNNHPQYGDLHYPHISVESDACLVAFTSDEDKGENDRQTTMKPRRYLQKFFKEYLMGDAYGYGEQDAASIIEEWATKFEVAVAKPTPYFAFDRYHIRLVFELSHHTVARSCMTHGLDSYSTDNIHPTEVYGAGDIAVAYLIDPSDKEHKKVIARALVYWDKKIFSRVYPTNGNDGWDRKLKGALIDRGFQQGNLVGAKLLRLENRRGNIICPYLDGISSVNADGRSANFLYIDHDGQARAENTNGLLCVETFSCESCQEDLEGEPEHFDNNGESICCTCYEEYYFYCESCNETEFYEDSEDIDGDRFCRTCVVNEAFLCSDCNNYRPNDERAGERDGESVCHDCVSDNEHIKDCGTIVMKEEVTVTTATCECCGEEELSREEQ